MAKSKQDVQRQFEAVAKAANLSTSADEAQKKGAQFYLSLDYSSTYGGYRLERLDAEKRTSHGVFGDSSDSPRLNTSQMHAYLRGLANGLNFCEDGNH